MKVLRKKRVSSEYFSEDFQSLLFFFFWYN